MGELETVMERLGAHARRLEERSRSARSANDDGALMVQTLALMSEALLRVGRDVRHLRNQLADRP
ncbi:hypothetical protein [Hansschlegelia sp. KR7-227]|jgi:hypothetical protein|uniref:hypothetical protein n=1 Tax=Hansschlegelia sp. KR7-227 TaxID=3400914 RepID=UPI003C125482